MRADDDFGEQAEEIIDEEELVLLRQMKDLKKVYRDNFNDLKNLKGDLQDAQSQIDIVKEQLLTNFEGWFRATFDCSGAVGMPQIEGSVPGTAEGNEDNNAGMGMQGGAHEHDDEMAVFKRAKKNVDIMHRAKK